MFSKKNWINANPKNPHFFLKLYSLDEFAICVMSTSKFHQNNPSLNIEPVSLQNPLTSYIYPDVYIIKENMSSVYGRAATQEEMSSIQDFLACYFLHITVVMIEDNGKFNRIPSHSEDSQYIRTLLKNAFIKAGLL